MRDAVELHDNLKKTAEFVLPQILDLRAATQLHREFLDKRGGPIVVDGSAVERIGGQCAAILLSARRSWASDGHEMRLAGVSPGLAQGLRLLGIDPIDIGAERSEEIASDLH